MFYVQVKDARDIRLHYPVSQEWTLFLYQKSGLSIGSGVAVTRKEDKVIEPKKGAASPCTLFSASPKSLEKKYNLRAKLSEDYIQLTTLKRV